jgi:hypothetical protein
MTKNATQEAKPEADRKKLPWTGPLLESLLRREIIGVQSPMMCDWYIAVLEEVENERALDYDIIRRDGLDTREAEDERAAIAAFSKLLRDAGPIDV